MANDEFQERLRRIANGSTHPRQPGRDSPVPEPAKGPNVGLMISAVVVFVCGSGLIRFANENYETLKADGGVGLALAVGLGAIATIILGLGLFLRSFRKRTAPVSRLSEPVPASGKTRRGALIMGLALGVAACFLMFVTSAARLLNPATDNVVSAFAFLAAIAITLLAVLVGIVGLIRRGSPLRRVPLYYLAGAILTFAAFRLFYIDLRNWPWFAGIVQ